MKTVSISVANQQFSKLIQQIEGDGQPIRILRRNQPVARLVPDNGHDEVGQTRTTALKEMRRLHDEGLELGGLRVDRDELHDRK